MTNRRAFILKTLAGTGFFSFSWPFLGSSSNLVPSPTNPGLDRPFSLYINWAAYDELSDSIPLTEDLAFRQLEKLLVMKKLGLKVEGYLMDMFWFDPGAGYRQWRKGSWSDSGPERWMKKCRDSGLLTGLWFSTNLMEAGGVTFLKTIPDWKDSISASGNSLCLSSGGYLRHLMDTLRMHYASGIRIFKFDFADFKAATPEMEAALLVSEIVEMNERALRSALLDFRKSCPESILIAYNGYGGMQSDTGSPFRKTVDSRWLEVFDALYCGDPRPSDVPCMNFWRSKDIYSDHMVWQYAENGIPPERIDNSAFMIGNTGTCYQRGKVSWRGTWLLSLARGANLHTMYGDLTLLSEEDIRFQTRSQNLFRLAFGQGKCRLTGGVPGKAQPYGYTAGTPESGVWTVCNPGQTVVRVPFPEGWNSGAAALLFADGGLQPAILDGKILLGPEQLALVGFGRWASSEFGLVGDKEPVTPQVPEEIQAIWESGPDFLKGRFTVDRPGRYRLVFQQFRKGEIPFRITGGSKPESRSLGQLLRIRVSSEGLELQVFHNYDKRIWSGLSWAVGEVEVQKAGIVEVRFESSQPGPGGFRGKVIRV